jgi:ATP-dependent Lon protease
MEERIQSTDLTSEDTLLPEYLPLLPLHRIVVYPNVVVPLAVTNPVLIRLVDESIANYSKLLVLATRREEDSENERFYDVGTTAAIAKMLKMSDGSVRILVQGMVRVAVREAVESKGLPFAKVRALSSVLTDPERVEALKRTAVNLFRQVVNLSPNLPDDLSDIVLRIMDGGKLADFIAANLNLEVEEKQALLETLNVHLRLEMLVKILSSELKVLEFGSKIQEQVKSELSKDQREYFLREQLKVIRRELGEEDEAQAEVRRLEAEVEAAKMPQEAAEMAQRELARMARMSPAAQEYHVARTYIDWLVSLPWNRESEDNLDIERARRSLDDDHYDIEKVKERILEYLAVRILKPDAKGPILCFVGPPGVGKTSLGRSIAGSLGREFVRLSLGGVRDEAEIRGHRRTYVGSLPGRIIQSMRRVKTRNPIFMLDEVDKLGSDFRGDPAAALLEVLDPEQNGAFSDHYLEVPFDLSRVMFITTANLLYPIPPALQDRMETIEIPGYLHEEKYQIARKFLIPKQMSEKGLTKDDVTLRDGAVSGIITDYTREAGVRNLEREIGRVLRKVAVRKVSGARMPVTLKRSDLADFLGPPKYFHETANRTHEVGVATGLGWSAAGGTLLFVEATAMKGSGKPIQLTGQLGNVLKESCFAAVSYLRSRSLTLRIPQDFFSQHDIHIHIPEGATPKDGPSAGVAVVASLASLITRVPVRRDVSMTGEITLTGKVLPVGGIKEKVMAAKRAGITTVLLPEKNIDDLGDIPAGLLGKMKIIPVTTIEEVLSGALLLNKTRRIKKK